MNYSRVLSEIMQSREINVRLIDQLLMPLAARQEKYEKYFLARLKKYSSIIRRLDRGFSDYLMTQYIAFQLFRKDGQGQKYLNHRKAKHISDDERSHVEYLLQYPWSFSFYRYKEELEDSFYTMVDICTGEEFTLYSGGTDELLEIFGKDILFFTLRGYNGDVDETYGVIMYFCSFTNQDILSFAKCIDSSVDEMSDIPALIANDPIPFMMLFAFAQIPKMDAYKDQEILVCRSEIENFFAPQREELEKEFTVEEKSGVYRCSDEKWSEVPHLGALYIDTNKKRLLLDTGTKEAYNALRDHAKLIDIPIAEEPDLAMSTAMVIATEDILKKKCVNEHYAHLFAREQPPEEMQ